MHSCSLQGRFTLKTVIFLTILIHQMKLSTGIKENSMFCGPENPDVSRNVFYFNKYFMNKLEYTTKLNKLYLSKLESTLDVKTISLACMLSKNVVSGLFLFKMFIQQDNKSSMQVRIRLTLKIDSSLERYFIFGTITPVF